MTGPAVAERRFHDLYDRHHRAVLAYCMRRIDRESAIDCAGDTFLVAWRRLDRVPEGDAALPWLYAVARKVIANHYRSRRRRRSLLDRLAGTGGRTDDPPDPEAEVVARAEDRDALAALARLSSADQELIRLAVWEELPHAQIGAALGCSAHAVDQRLHRATRRLAREMEAFGHTVNRTAPRTASIGDET